MAPTLNTTPESSNQSHASSLKDRFLAPLLLSIQLACSGRSCPVFSDSDWLNGGIKRVLNSFDSGRDFLQCFPKLNGSISGYFDTLKSKRRLQWVVDVSKKLIGKMGTIMPDQIAEAMPVLDGFDVFAGDGHFHTHATHDLSNGGSKYAVGHLYGLNLRSKALVHLTCADQVNRKKEHDMRGLKRLEIDELRQDSKTGKKVIWIWDRAGIDFRQWFKWKVGSGIYFISRTKENMKTDEDIAPMCYDRNDLDNEGIIGDFLWSTSTGVQMRVVRFRDAVSDEDYEFVTSLTNPSIPPGVIAQLYRMRWDIEKAFDEIKNKTHEKKAWASTATAKTIQAQLITITYNLMRMFERELEITEKINNKAEMKRKTKRLDRVKDDLKTKGKQLPKPYVNLIRITQISVKFIRWLRYHVFNPTSDARALALLRKVYSKS